MAVIQGNTALVNLLIANKANVNAIDNEGHSVVHWAAGELYEYIFHLLSLSPFLIDSNSIVNLSKVCGEVEALRGLLAAGADVTITDLNGGSPVRHLTIYVANHRTLSRLTLVHI